MSFPPRIANIGSTTAVSKTAKVMKLVTAAIVVVAIATVTALKMRAEIHFV